MMNLIICLISFFFFVSGCTPLQTSDEPIETLQLSNAKKQSRAKTADWKLFYKGEEAYSNKNYEEASRYYKLAKSKNSRSRVHLISSYRLGTVYYNVGQFRKASAEFTHILDKFPRSDLEFDVVYNLAASEFQLNNYEATYAALSELEVKEIEKQGPVRASMVYRLTALSALALKNYPAAIVALSHRIQLPIEAQKKERTRAHIEKILPRVQTRLELENLQAVVIDPHTRGLIQDRLESGDTTVASEDMELPPGGAGTRVESFESGQTRSLAQQNHIGVVLPLTGKWAPFGKRALDSILLASQKLKERNRGSFKIFIRDTRSNPITAAHAVDSLVNRDNVFAIVGPISWEESLAVARRSQKLGVPNLLLTLREGLSVRGSHLFQTGITPRIQLENLVKYCMKELEFKRFAILSPEDKYGQDLVHQFWDLVEAAGGQVVAYETYPAKETDFQQYIRNMVGLSQPQLRKNEWKALQEYVEEESSKRNRPVRASLPPVIDFDAIFIPDTPKAVGQIAPSLAYFDVVGVPLLGTAEWQNDKLYRRGGRHVEGAIFPGGINLATGNEQQREFISAYQKAYGMTPDLLAAQAFEAMEILGEVIPQTGSAQRDRLARQLSQLEEYSTMLGKITFDDARVARRDLPIFTVGRGGRLTEK